MRALFISYRRSDAEAEAGRLSDVLGHRFSEQSVFMDVEAIQPGRDFRKAIEESLQKCAVLLTVIGPDWLEARGHCDLRRLDDAGDYVRLEIAAALRRDIPVIPVLVRGAKMPQPGQLPSDLQVLMRALEPYMAHTAAPGAAHPVPPAPPHAVQPQSPHPAPHSAPHSAAAEPEAAAGALPADAIEKVTKLLGFHIGPIAAVVVKRAAKSASSLHALSVAVGSEIESPAGRKEFLAHFHERSS